MNHGCLWKILIPDESYEGSSRCSLGMQDFRKCTEDLGITDLNTSGMNFTWVSRKDDPFAGILKKLDRDMILLKMKSQIVDLV